MSKLKRPNTAWIENTVKSVLTFGKKNATSLMTGGGIILGWAAVYVFWKQSKDAEKAIQYEEKKRSEEKGEPVELEKKEKFIFYLQYCWVSLLMGLGSTGLSLYSHKLDLDEIAKAYMLSQFYKGKNDDNEKLVEKLKEEIKPKKLEEIENETVKEKIEQELNNGNPIIATGKGNTLFVSDYGGIKFRSSITEVNKGLYRFKTWLRDKRTAELKRQFAKQMADPFFASDNPYPNPDDMDIYSSADVDDFFECFGLRGTKLGTLLEFRDYGYDDYLSDDDVLKYTKDVVDPDTGEPVVCYIMIEQFLRPTNELMERDP